MQTKLKLRKMKRLQYVLGVALLITAIWSCTNDDFGSTEFLETAQAPSNLSALFNVTQDNTGLVTITPNAEGAVAYDVAFGDGNTTASKVKQGESILHTYAEGTYQVKLIGYGITGLTSETELPLEVSFKAPENLEVTIENDVSVSKKVNVTAIADYAMTFDVYFGEAGKDDPVSANIGDVASYVYQEAGTYTIRVVAKSAAIETTTYTQEFEVTAILQPVTSAPTPKARQEGDVISVYSNAYTNIEGSNYNPDWGQSGQGSSYAEYDLNGDTMLQYINLSYQGIDLGAPVNAVPMEYLHIDVWTADVTSIDIFPLPAGVQPDQERFVTKELVPNEWNSIDIHLTEFTDQGLVLDNLAQFKFVGNPWAAGTVFIDNLYFYKAPTESVEMPITFESSTLNYAWSGFGDANFGPIEAGVISNPDQSGNNTSAHVVKINKPSGAQVWAGASIDLGARQDFSEGTTVNVLVWSPRAGTPIMFKMEDSMSAPDGNGNPSVFVEVLSQTTVANQWEMLRFDLTTFEAFNTSNNYDRVILFPDFGNVGLGEDFYFDDIKIEGTGEAGITFPITFESTSLEYVWNGFGDANFGAINAGVIDNPDATGENTSSKVTHINKPTGGQVWAGASLDLAGAADFSSGNTTIKVKVWSPRSGVPIMFKMEDSTSEPDGNGNPSVFVEVLSETTVANQWEELSFDLTTFEAFSASNMYDRVILFPDFGNIGDNEDFYFDDIIQTN